MANALLSPVARQRFHKPDGTPASGYKLTTYASGTTTPQATYSDRAGTVPNPNPIILDADGYAPAIYLTAGLVYDYKFTSDTGGVQWTQPGVSAEPPASNGLVRTVAVEAGATSITVPGVAVPFAVVQVFYNGVYQERSAYTHTGNTITFSEALPSAGNVEVWGSFTVPAPLPDADSLYVTLGTTARSVPDKLGDVISVKDFGAVGDGVTDDTAAFNAALAHGRDVLVPDAVHYRITGALVFTDGAVLTGDGSRPEVRWDNTTSALMFNLDGRTGAGFCGLTINGSKASTPSAKFASLDSATRCRVERNRFVDCAGPTAGGLMLSGTASENTITHNEFVSSGGSAVGLSGYSCRRNVVSDNLIENAQGFGVRVGDGANGNELSGNRTYANGIELIGITADCYENRVIGNHAEGCGDNGISVSGYRNTVIGNVCVRNQKAGIWSWGSFNTINGNACLNNNLENAGNNWAGIGVSANYGGTGQHNVISGNLCDDDQDVPTQFNGVRLAGSAYVAWAAGQAITASSDYRVNGLNVYQAVTGGTTGAAAPTHTSGDVSDGGVVWRFKRAFLTSATSGYNTVADNNAPRSASATYFDAGSWATNVLIDRQQVSQTTAGSQTWGVGAGGAFFWNVGGSGELRLTATELRPETDSGLSLGLSNRRWSAVYTAGVHTGASGATQQVVGTRRTGWAAATGTADRTAFDTGTVTTADLARRLKALLDDLIAHGMIGP